MDECFEVPDLPLVAHDEPAEVLQPRVRPLDDPAPLVTPQLAPVLVRRLLVVPALRDDRFDVARYQQRPRRVGVVAPVGDEPLRLVRAPVLPAPPLHFNRVERPFEEPDFRRGSRLHAYSERKTRAICQNHKLRPLAALGLAHTLAPFLAATNMPSTKHSFHRIFFRSLSWSRNARHRSSSTPESAHSERRRCTAVFEPYLSGNSLHGAPVQSIQRIPSKHCRSLSGGRPPFGLRFRLGRCASMSLHCLSVTARQAISLVSYRTGISCQLV
jgi:hypothetical protein